jgi:hypothetical protein
MYTQKDKVDRGAKGEELITSSLKAAGVWSHKFINAGYGTVFDKLVVLPGGGYGIEVKTSLQPRIPYSKVTGNERRGLDKFMKMVGEDYAWIIGVWKTENFCRAFRIRWADVREGVLSGCKGSINMLESVELERRAGGWDMEWMKHIREGEGKQ